MPEYVSALKNAAESGEAFDDRKVFEIIRTVWVSELKDRHYRSARQVIQNISRDLYGDPHAWQYK